MTLSKFLTAALLIAATSFPVGCSNGDTNSTQPPADVTGPVDAGNDGANTAPPDGTVQPDSLPNTDTAPQTHAEEFIDELYLTVGGIQLRMDVRIPEGSGPFPVVLVVHGGAFVQGEKTQGNVVEWAKTLAANGFVSAAVDYRLTGQFISPPAFPGPVQDLKCAIRVLRAQASRFRINIDKVFVLGGSAGGYFASMLGATNGVTQLDGTCPDGANQSSHVSGVVAYFGIADWTTINTQRGNTEPPPASETVFVGSGCTAPSDQACIDASPTTFIDASDPPFFLLHSDDDPAVPVAQSQQLRDALKKAGVSVTYLEVTGKGHGWLSKFGDPEIAAARDQVLTWLKGL